MAIRLGSGKSRRRLSILPYGEIMPPTYAQGVKFIALIVFGMTAVLSSSLFAQDNRFFFTFRGTSVITNGSGNFVTRRITERTWLEDYARTAGIADPKTLRMVYHLGADQRGDVLEIVDAKTGASIYPYFSFFFAVS